MPTTTPSKEKTVPAVPLQIDLRSWFAGQALPSVIGLIGIPEDGPDDLWDASIAERAYAIADAMIAERAKGGAS